MTIRQTLAVLSLAVWFCGCAPAPAPKPAASVRAFRGATVIVQPEQTPISGATILVRDGRVEAVGPQADVSVPPDAEVVDLSGKVVIPGLISAHVHVSDVNGLAPRAYTPENTLRQLGVYARYGITSVLSLGGEKEPAFRIRDAQDTADLRHARLFVSGDVIVAKTPEEARAEVIRVAAGKPDWIKIRVDDNLGTTAKMPPEVYRAVIEEAHRQGLRLAAHVFYLDDAKELLKAGADLIAHSVRDKDIDEEFITLMKARNIPYCPTLTRELSTFVYKAKPGFFDDPFFRAEADPAVVESLLLPASMEKFRNSKAAAQYEAALQVAKRNLKKAHEAGLLIAMGTDAGPAPERFPGYFEHLEMEMMAESGMPAAAILASATSRAAQALQRQDLGRLTPGAWADFVVLSANPLEDIRHTRRIAEVRIAGNRVEAKPAKK
jgi:imidazolonepropionase-like amidohydrolase